MEPDAAKSFLPIERLWARGHEVYVRHLETGVKSLCIDFEAGGIFVANVGNANPAVCTAITDTVSDERISSYNQITQERREYTEALCARTGFECVALFSAGCEAVEAALRVMDPPRPEITVWPFSEPNYPRLGYIWGTPGSFMHGRTLGTLLIRSLEAGDFPRKDARGIILESYRGWDAHFWDKKWIQDLRAYCTEHDILLCFDEIQSGFGRTGRFFCYEHYDVLPDLVCIGKAMGGGLPLSGLLGSKALLDLPGDLSSTHSGNPLICAAGLAVLEETERLNLVEEARQNGTKLQSRLIGMLDWTGASPRVSLSVGMVAAILTETVEQANHIVTECFNRGLLVVHTGRESVKIGPPLTISDEALGKGLDILEGVLNAE